MAGENNAMIIDFSASDYFSSQALECMKMGGMSFCRRMDFAKIFLKSPFVFKCNQKLPNWATEDEKITRETLTFNIWCLWHQLHWYCLTDFWL